MSESTTIRISRKNHEELRALAERDGVSIAQVVSRGTRLVRQEGMGQSLREPLRDDEIEWLEAEAG